MSWALPKITAPKYDPDHGACVVYKIGSECCVFEEHETDPSPDEAEHQRR